MFVNTSLLQYTVIMESTKRETLLHLMNTKSKIESDIAELMGVLESNHVDMTQPLVDAEGFPRSDIDVYQIRHARHRIICLQNDYKTIMKQIEQGLHNLHGQQREGLGLGSSANASIELRQLVEEAVSFVKVENVLQASPAALAGLKNGDLVISIGSLRASNFRTLADVATLVQHSEGRTIPLVVHRNTDVMTLSLTPRSWSGRGLLGCTLVPVEHIDR